MPPVRAMTDTVASLRADLARLQAVAHRQSLIDQAVGLLAGRVDCGLRQAHDELARIAAEQGRDIADVAADLLQVPPTGSAERPGSPPTPPRLDVFDPARYLTVASASPPAQTEGPARPARPSRKSATGLAPDPVHLPTDVQEMLDMFPGAASALAPIRDPAGEIVDFVTEAASPGAVDIAGRHGNRLVGVRILDTYPTIVDTDLWQAYLDVMAGGESRDVGPFTYTEVVEGVPAEATYTVRVHRFGSGLLVSWVGHDEEHRHAEQLARTQRLGSLGWAEWDLTRDRRSWSEYLYTIFERDPAKGPLTLDQVPDLVLPEDLPAVEVATEALLGRGEPIDIECSVRAGDRVKRLRVIADAICDVSGHALRVQAIIQDITPREQARRHLAEISYQLAEHRRSLQAEHALAIRLQQIILPLPETPMDFPGLRVVVQYLPAEHVARVGGDWYHAAPGPEGRILLAVGDVAGHGLAAAATMARLRHALAALATITVDPAELLSHLNRLVYDSGLGTATAVVFSYHPEERSLVWAQAGHPAPILARDGAAGLLPRPPGVILGAVPEPEYGTATVAFDLGDVLLLYTDGLVEHRQRSLDEGTENLITAVAEAIAESNGAPLAGILQRLRQANPDDDTCIVAARPVPRPGSTQQPGPRQSESHATLRPVA